MPAGAHDGPKCELHGWNYKMGGARNRRAGNGYERELCHYIGQSLDCEIVTSRSGRGGTQHGGDLEWREHGADLWHPGVRGWEVEAKAVKSKAVPAWLRQAASNAPGDWFMAVRRTPGTYDRSGDSVFLPRRMLLDWLIHRMPTVDRYDVDDYLELTLDQWTEVVS